MCSTHLPQELHGQVGRGARLAGRVARRRRRIGVEPLGLRRRRVVQPHVAALCRQRLGLRFEVGHAQVSAALEQLQLAALLPPPAAHLHYHMQQGEILLLLRLQGGGGGKGRSLSKVGCFGSAVGERRAAARSCLSPAACTAAMLSAWQPTSALTMLRGAAGQAVQREGRRLVHLQGSGPPKSLPRHC